MKKYLLLFILLISITCGFAQKGSTDKKTNLKKYQGTYILASSETFEEGDLIFKLKNGVLVGSGEQTILPMRGLMKLTVKVTKLDSSGKGKCKYTYANFDRWGKPIQTNTTITDIFFQSDGVTIYGVFHEARTGHF